MEQSPNFYQSNLLIVIFQDNTKIHLFTVAKWQNDMLLCFAGCPFAICYHSDTRPPSLLVLTCSLRHRVCIVSAVQNLMMETRRDTILWIPQWKHIDLIVAHKYCTEHAIIVPHWVWLCTNLVEAPTLSWWPHNSFQFLYSIPIAVFV